MKDKESKLIFRLRNKRQWLLENVLEASQTMVSAALGFPMERGASDPNNMLSWLSLTTGSDAQLDP